jgi:hypothetical protein
LSAGAGISAPFAVVVQDVGVTAGETVDAPLLQPRSELDPLRDSQVDLSETDAGAKSSAAVSQVGGAQLAVDQIPGRQPDFLPKLGGTPASIDRPLGDTRVLGQRGEGPGRVGVASVEVSVQGVDVVR